MHIFDSLGIPFKDVCKGLWLDGDGAVHEFWNVIAPHELTVIVRVGTWQFKGFGAVSVLVDVGKEWTGIGAIVTATAEDYPLAVARPGVITLRVR